MKAIFKTIQDTITAQVAAVRWTDFDLGQLDAEKPPVSFPCALIGFNAGDYTLLGQDTNIGSVLVEISLAFRLRERTHSIATESFRDEALEHIDVVEAVRVALTGLDGDDFQSLTYLGFSNDRRADLRVWRLRFSCAHYPMEPESPFQPLEDGVDLDLCLQPDIEP
jgi:hypothetical protein